MLGRPRLGCYMRRALVGLFGAPHCGGRDMKAVSPRPQCRLDARERKRLYVAGGPCPCRRP